MEDRECILLCAHGATSHDHGIESITGVGGASGAVIVGGGGWLGCGDDARWCLYDGSIVVVGGGGNGSGGVGYDWSVVGSWLGAGIEVVVIVHPRDGDGCGDDWRWLYFFL